MGDIHNYSDADSICKICKNLQKDKVNKPIHFTSSSMSHVDIPNYSCRLSLFKNRESLPDCNGCIKFNRKN